MIQKKIVTEYVGLTNDPAAIMTKLDNFLNAKTDDCEIISVNITNATISGQDNGTAKPKFVYEAFVTSGTRI